MAGLLIEANDNLAWTRGVVSISGETPRSTRGVSALAGALCVVVSLTASALFLPHQSFWNDEATQMAGLSLSPAEQVRWLAGRVHYSFGVPEDRMPPLSYWAGWAWSRAFGLDEVPMRWMGVVAVGLATLLLFLAAARAWGLGPGLAASLLFGLSPNVINQAVEIRAYPLLLLASAASLYCLMRLLADPASARPGWLAGLTACAVVAVYTHFFGLVLAGAAMLAAMVLVPARGGRLRPLVTASALVGLLSLGLLPFVTASVDLSGGPVQVGRGRAIELARLLYRLVAHPATSVSRTALVLAILGGAVAGLAALAPKRRSGTASAGLLLVLMSGGMVIAAAHFAQSKFAAASPSYNVWMLPTLSLWLASGLASNYRKVRQASLLGITLLLSSNVYAVGQLAVHGDSFAHTSHRAVETLIRRYGPGRVALILDADQGPLWHVYAPVRYEFGGEVRQYALDRRSPGPLRVAEYPDPGEPTDPLALAADYLVVIRPATLRAEGLVVQIRGGAVPLGDGPAALALKADDRWSLVSETTHPTFVQVDIDVFRRVGAESPGLD
jgi:hypothetical protein